MQETQVRSPDHEDPLEKGMSTNPSMLAWRISWTEEPDGLQSMGLQRVRHDRASKHKQRADDTETALYWDPTGTVVQEWAEPTRLFR